MAAAGLWTTPIDLGRLALAVQASYQGAPARLLSEEMAQEQLTAGQGTWGLGFGIRGEGPSKQFRHGGSNYGFKSHFTGYAEGGRGVIVMTNGDGGRALTDEVREAVILLYGWPTP